MRRLVSWWSAPAALIVALGIWELYVDLGGADALVLPPPHAIAQALYEDRGLLWSNFLVTAKEVLLGILLSAVAALGLAIAIHLSVTVRRAVYPLLVASQTIPVPMLAPVLLLWLGFGLGPIVLVVALVSFFVIVVTTLAGLAAIDPALTKTMRSFGATRMRLLWHIELPSALPGLFTGIKVAVVFAVIGAVFGEQSGVNAGLGYLFEVSQAQLLVARSWATIVILSVFAIALFALMTLAERLALPWAHQPTGEINR